MKFREFLDAVSERAGTDRDQAEKATRATLNTLAQRLAGGEPTDLADQLPSELKDTVMLTTYRGFGQSMSAKQFLETVAEREGCSAEEARPHVQAVMATLRDAVTAGEFDDITAQLGPEYRDLVYH
jgi:uncharacterized protein (DUF2267 family)